MFSVALSVSQAYSPHCEHPPATLAVSEHTALRSSDFPLPRPAAGDPVRTGPAKRRGSDRPACPRKLHHRACKGSTSRGETRRVHGIQVQAGGRAILPAPCWLSLPCYLHRGLRLPCCGSETLPPQRARRPRYKLRVLQLWAACPVDNRYAPPSLPSGKNYAAEGSRVAAVPRSQKKPCPFILRGLGFDTHDHTLSGNPIAGLHSVGVFRIHGTPGGARD
jgi:hypothetical protein